MAAFEPLGPDPSPATVPNATASWTRLVLETYTQMMARSRDERGAFDAAVAVYRAQHPDSS